MREHRTRCIGIILRQIVKFNGLMIVGEGTRVVLRRVWLVRFAFYETFCDNSKMVSWSNEVLGQMDIYCPLIENAINLVTWTIAIWLEYTMYEMTLFYLVYEKVLEKGLWRFLHTSILWLENTKKSFDMLLFGFCYNSTFKFLVF